MHWRLSWRAEPAANLLAKRHYNCQSPDSDQFTPPGESIVLPTEPADALWVSLRQKFTDHAWPGAWLCTLFRNEGPCLSSALIREAVAVTRYVWGEPPGVGFITFVDAKAVRHKRDPGRCFIRAGFRKVGVTARYKRLAFQLLPDDMPEPLEPVGMQRELFAEG